MRNIKIANTPLGTTVWNLCRKWFDNFQYQLYRIPGSGKKTFLWEDKILGNLPLSSINSLSDIKIWLTNKGFLRLADICNWDSDGNWVGWVFHETSVHLISQQNLLIPHLSGMALVNCFSKDVWGWGSIGKYSVGLGFSILQSSTGPCSSPAIWKNEWSCPCLPKANFFSWLLLHSQVLTGENLQR